MAMSSFGVKAPLRKEIVNNDFYMEKAIDLVNLFNKKDMGERKHYREVTKRSYDSQPCPIARKIEGNTKMHCIVFHCDGMIEFCRDICECDECFYGNLSKCEYNKEDVVVISGENDEEGNDDSDEDDDDDNGPFFWTLSRTTARFCELGTPR